MTAKVIEAHEISHGTYGSPRVTAKLKQSGEEVSEKTVAKMMQENELVARHKRRFKATTDSRHTKRIADNLLQRDFTTRAPNRAWVTDVTAVWTTRGWGFLAVIADLFSRRVIGWAMSENNDTTIALAALEKAIALRRPNPGLIHHSDRGSPYGSDDYIARLDALGIVRSMSRKGDCWDNAVAESLFSTLEFECRSLHAFVDVDDARSAVGQYIDGFYNPQRLHSANGYSSPIEFEIASALDVKAA